MKKNTIIISLIFAIPLIAYFILSSNEVSYAQKNSTTTKSELIKFSSKMCMDCKKMSKTLNEIYPKYENKISLTEVNVQNSDKKTKNYIEQYNISLVPTMIFLDENGKQTRRVEGAIDKTELDRYLKELANE